MHITIHKLIWQLHAPTQQTAIAGQKVAAELSRNSAFLAALEARLSVLNLADEHVVIPKLEIDLGKYSEAALKRNFGPEVLQKLQSETDEKAPKNQTAELVRLPLAQKRALDFAYLVYTGNKPSSWPKGLRTHLEIARWIAAEAANNIEFSKELAKALLASREMQQALARLPATTYLKAFAQSLKLNHSITQELQKAILFLEANAPVEELQKANMIVWQYVLNSPDTSQDNVLLLLARVVKKVVSALPEKKQGAAITWLEKNEPKPTVQIRAKEKVEPQNATKPNFEDETQAGYFIENAGLVLVAPFLTALFAKLGVVQGSQLKSPSKALALLAAIDLGKHSNAGANKTLYKLLSGMALNEALPEKTVLTKKQNQEAEELLKAMIGYWPALKNTSPDGLRTGFFWREGVLTQKDHGYLLKVETKAQDILLGSLPWSISIIKLPWMDEPLHVDWA